MTNASETVWGKSRAAIPGPWLLTHLLIDYASLEWNQSRGSSRLVVRRTHRLDDCNSILAKILNMGNSQVIVTVIVHALENLAAKTGSNSWAE
jgi:hypothetical protein